jgi:hypothetical protein
MKPRKIKIRWTCSDYARTGRHVSTFKHKSKIPKETMDWAKRAVDDYERKRTLEETHNSSIGTKDGNHKART